GTPAHGRERSGDRSRKSRRPAVPVERAGSRHGAGYDRSNDNRNGCYPYGVRRRRSWGPPESEILGAYSRGRLRVLCLPPELRRGLFRTLWCGAKRTNWSWRFTRSRRTFRSRKLTAWRCKAEESKYPSRTTFRKELFAVCNLEK